MKRDEGVEQVQTDDQVDFYFFLRLLSDSYPAPESITLSSLQAFGQP